MNYLLRDFEPIWSNITIRSHDGQKLAQKMSVKSL